MISIRQIVYVGTDNPGEIRQKLSGRAKSEDSTAAGPSFVFQVDATPVDVYLVSSCNRNSIIARPTVYFINDETDEPKRALESA